MTVREGHDPAYRSGLRREWRIATCQSVTINLQFVHYSILFDQEDWKTLGSFETK
jgi:hypothetical protein